MFILLYRLMKDPLGLVTKRGKEKKKTFFFHNMSTTAATDLQQFQLMEYTSI